MAMRLTGAAPRSRQPSRTCRASISPRRCLAQSALAASASQSSGAPRGSPSQAAAASVSSSSATYLTAMLALQRPIDRNARIDNHHERASSPPSL